MRWPGHAANREKPREDAQDRSISPSQSPGQLVRWRSQFAGGGFCRARVGVAVLQHGSALHRRQRSGTSKVMGERIILMAEGDVLPAERGWDRKCDGVIFPDVRMGCSQRPGKTLKMTSSEPRMGSSAQSRGGREAFSDERMRCSTTPEEGWAGDLSRGANGVFAAPREGGGGMRCSAIVGKKPVKQEIVRELRQPPKTE